MGIRLEEPGCVVDEKSKTIVCRAKWSEGGKRFTLEDKKPVVFRLTGNGKAVLVDGGNAKPEVIDQLARHIEKRVLL
ncbi:MAG: hypothetical protein ACE5J4_02265 [Candidatus Aenigmatarchaeota archaeon]